MSCIYHTSKIQSGFIAPIDKPEDKEEKKVLNLDSVVCTCQKNEKRVEKNATLQNIAYILV